MKMSRHDGSPPLKAAYPSELQQWTNLLSSAQTQWHKTCRMTVQVWHEALKNDTLISDAYFHVYQDYNPAQQHFVLKDKFFST